MKTQLNQLLQIAVYQMGISPKDFWEMTPKEFMMLVPYQEEISNDTLANIQELMKKFPD